MALWTDTPGRERNPLGGCAADSFDRWLTYAAQVSRETRDDLRERLDLDDPMRYVAGEAARHYVDVLTEWGDVKAGRSRYVRDDLTRDHFEVGLIARVMGAYGALQYAREQGYGSKDVTLGGRPMVDVSTEYMRACIILAKYVGVDGGTVAACQDDQDAFLALRKTRA